MKLRFWISNLLNDQGMWLEDDEQLSNNIKKFIQQEKIGVELIGIVVEEDGEQNVNPT